MFGFALLCAGICVVFGFAGVTLFRDLETSTRWKWAIGSIIGNLLMNLILVYLIMPAQTGPLGGLQYLWLPLLINTLFSGIIWLVKLDSNDETARSGEFVGSGAALVILGIVLLVVHMASNWGEGKAKYKADYLPILSAEMNTFPATDPDHLVLVPLEVAEVKGSRTLTEGGENLGAIYKPGSYTLQNIDSHMYWVAPLIYKNLWANLSNMTSPGLIVVDAENPDLQGHLNRDNPLHYLPDAIFNQDLKRHAYLNGYAGFRLIDATLEIDDDWVPHFTLDASSYVLGLIGIKVDEILVINSGTGEILSYSIEDKPAWIDRVIPEVATDDYVKWYGRWEKAPWSPFKNWQRRDIEAIAGDSALAYSSVDSSPVFQYVMSSESSTDHASTGVILVDSNKLSGTRYPVYGIAVGSQVDDAFNNTPDNKVNQYPHSAPILTNIYGQLTWFTVYMDKNSTYGATFVGVGLMDAYSTGVSSVIMAPSKEEALARYHQWLTNKPSNTTEVGQEVVDLAFEGTIGRVQSEVQNGVTYYFFYAKDLSGKASPIVFFGIADLQTAELRFAREGDRVAFSYKLTNDGTGTISEFDDLELPGQ